MDGSFLVEGEIVLESSFVAEALIPTQPHHAECRGFIGQLAAFGTTVYYSELLVPELWEAAYQIGIRELHGSNRDQRLRADGRTRRRSKLRQKEMQEAWEQTLLAIDSVCLTVGEVAEWIPAMMGYGLKSNDAIHAATAVFADVRAMATMDFHFAAVPGNLLTLYVPEHRVRACRKLRG